MPNHRKPEVVVLDSIQLTSLKAYLKVNPGLTALGVLLSLYTGLRIGELCALQWKNIDLEKRILTVRKTIQRIHDYVGKSNTKLVITAPKSQNSVREIPLPKHIISMLNRYKMDSENFVLSGNKKPVEPRLLQYRFARILDNAKLPSVHFHSLRQAFATNCIAVGFDVKTLSEILGHSSVKLTLDRYVHSSIDRKREFMELLSA